MLSQNTLALEAQVEERPLAKKQEELQETAKEEAAEKAEHDASESPSAENGGASTPLEQHEKREKPVQKALLKNDDSELDRIQQVRLGTGFPQTIVIDVWAEDPGACSRAILCGV